ncbi:MAG: universal stress protein [Gammaproteobacteria bacterium]|nr:universal stress protein [Gammaproteobacteria bacterium]
MNINRILCPLDFSESSRKVLESAVFLTSTYHAQLQLLHVVDHLHGFDNYQILVLTPQEIAERMEKNADENLSELLGHVKEPINIEKVIKHGKASVKIIEAASETKTDLIVMGSHGRSGLSHALVGSVAEAVARHAPCTVLIVRDAGQ